MSKFHVNPNTGNPNVCPDEWECKFANAEGVIPPHYATKDEAKKAVEAVIFEAFSVAETASDSPESKAADESNAADPEEEELKGSESLEKAIKIARKTAITISAKKQDALEGLKELKDKAPDLSSIRSKIKKPSK